MYDDIQVRNAWETLVQWKLYPESQFLAGANQIARDHARTPFQWSDGPNAEFTSGQPWAESEPQLPDRQCASTGQ